MIKSKEKIWNIFLDWQLHTFICQSLRCLCAYNVMLGFTWRKISVGETDFFHLCASLHHLSFSLFLFSINAEKKKSVIPIYRSSRCLAERSVLSFLCHAPCWNEIKKQQKDKARKSVVKNERIERSHFDIKAKLLVTAQALIGSIYKFFHYHFHLL